MRSCWIIAAFLQHARQFGAAGLFLLAAIAFAGNAFPIRNRSVTIDGLKSSYALPRGATSFIMRLTNSAHGHSVIFVNENAAAEGQLSIAVSNHFLAADSPRWDKVEGVIRFQHKKMFTVSLVGVDANYVRLTFQVEMPDENANSNSSVGHPRRKAPVTPSTSALERGIVTANRAATTAIIRP